MESRPTSTVDAEEKKAQIDRFFDARTDDAWREEFLRLYGVDAVFWGPAERALGGFDLRGRALPEADVRRRGLRGFCSGEMK